MLNKGEQLDGTDKNTDKYNEHIVTPYNLNIPIITNKEPEKKTLLKDWVML